MKRFDDLLDTSRAIDTHEAYRDMLRELYADSLQGPFAHLDPAKILEEMAPVDFRCGHVDYVDSQDWTEYNGEEYETDYLEEVREECESDIDNEIEALEEAKEELEEELENLADEPAEPFTETRIIIIRTELQGIDDALAALEEERQQLAKLF